MAQKLRRKPEITKIDPQVSTRLTDMLTSRGYTADEARYLVMAAIQSANKGKPVITGRLMRDDVEKVAETLLKVKYDPEKSGRIVATAKLDIKGPESAPRISAIPRKIEEGKHKYRITMGRNTYVLSSTKPFRPKGMVRLERSRIADLAKEFIARPGESSITSIRLVSAAGERRLSPAERREFTKEYFERYREMSFESQLGKRPKPRIRVTSG